MTTLAANKPRAYELGERNHLPVIASDIIYEGAAVGVVDASGHARPLNAADRFAGFAVAKADNSAGAAAAIYVEVVKSGEIEIAVTGAVITDAGQPVYASDDDTFTFNPADGAFIGFVKRFVSSGVAVVEFNAGVIKDPWAHKTVRETLTGVKTFDAQDTGFHAKLTGIELHLKRIQLACADDRRQSLENQKRRRDHRAGWCSPQH